MKPLNQWSTTQKIVLSTAVIFVIFAIVKRGKIYTYYKNMTNELYLQGLHPLARPIFESFIKEVKEKTGIDLIFTSGNRSFKEQAILKQKDSKNASAGNSMHNFGMAGDFNGFKDGKDILKKATPAKEWKPVVDIAKSMGLFWGGDLKGYADNVHFDLRNKYTLASLKSLALAQYGSDPNKVQGNKLKIA